MMRRDSYGFIGQTGVFADGSVNFDDFDFGDCAARTGILAMTGSEQDIALMHEFVTEDNLLMRHPHQSERKYTDPLETSRDALVCWAGGIANMPEGAYKTKAQACALKYAKAGRINKDFLSYDIRLFLYRAADVKPPMHIYALGMANVRASIFWACYVKPDHELNQNISMLSKFEVKFLSSLCLSHPSWIQNLVDYWDSWRRMPEISTMIINYVNLRKAS